MKSWKEVPHLFANGKFDISGDGYVLSFVPSLIHKHRNKQYILHSAYGLGRHTTNIEDCTLIARPISDMSDKEKLTLYHQTGRNKEIGSWREALSSFKRTDSYYHFGFNIYPDNEFEKKFIKFLINTRNGLIYLLSIGVYPFDNNNDPEDVIWRYENDNKE